MILDADLACAHARAASAVAQPRAIRVLRIPAHRRRQRARRVDTSIVSCRVDLWRARRRADVGERRRRGCDPRRALRGWWWRANASAILACVGLARRGLLRSAWVLVLTPLHWLLLSLAAWRALIQLVVAPYRWEKTEHGPPQSSRLASRTSQALSSLERYLSRLLVVELPAELAPEREPYLTYISAAPRRTRPASA